MTKSFIDTVVCSRTDADALSSADLARPTGEKQSKAEKSEIKQGGSASGM